MAAQGYKQMLSNPGSTTSCSREPSPGWRRTCLRPSIAAGLASTRNNLPARGGIDISKDIKRVRAGPARFEALEGQSGAPGTRLRIESVLPVHELVDRTRRAYEQARRAAAAL